MELMDVLNKNIADSIRFRMKFVSGVLAKANRPFVPPPDDVSMGTMKAIGIMINVVKPLATNIGVRQNSFHSFKRSAIVWLLVLAAAFEIWLGESRRLDAVDSIPAKAAL